MNRTLKTIAMTLIVIGFILCAMLVGSLAVIDEQMVQEGAKELFMEQEVEFIKSQLTEEYYQYVLDGEKDITQGPYCICEK